MTRAMAVWYSALDGVEDVLRSAEYVPIGVTKTALIIHTMMECVLTAPDTPEAAEAINRTAILVGRLSFHLSAGTTGKGDA